MKAREFDRLIQAAGLKSPSVPACRLVLVQGKSINEAARRYGISPAAVSRMLKKIPTRICPACGQPVRDKQPP